MGGLWVALAAPAAGQTIENRGYRPIDQLRDDVDPLSRSLRRSDAGLSTTGERQNVYRAGDAADGRLYYLARGVIAEFDRSDYALTRRGRILQLAPPNLVYHIDPPKAAQPHDDSPIALTDQMLDGRVDGRVRAEVNNRAAPEELIAFRVAPIGESFVQPDRQPRSTWEHYHHLHTVNRMVVLGALRARAPAGSSKGR